MEVPSKNNTRQQVASCFVSRCFAIHQPGAQKPPRRRRREISKHLSCKVLSPPVSGVEPSPLSRPASSRLSLHRILPSQPFKAPETCLTSRPRGWLPDPRPQRRRRGPSLRGSRVAGRRRQWRRVCAGVRSVKEFIVCSPPVIILVPINLLASLEPVAIWKHCSVYKLGKDQHSGALTSHTNLETIRARQSG